MAQLVPNGLQCSPVNSHPSHWQMLGALLKLPHHSVSHPPTHRFLSLELDEPNSYTPVFLR